MTAGAARVVVTVDGFDGSGKSILAERLAAALGTRARLLHVDDVRRPVAWATVDDEARAYYEARYDLAALDGVVAAFRAGAPSARFVGFDGATETLGPEQVVDLAGVDHLVLEGVFVARLRALGDDACRIWLDVPVDEARRRIHLRDEPKGRTPDEVARRIATRYVTAHERYLREEDPRARASIVIDNQTPRAPRVVLDQTTTRPRLDAVRAALAAVLARARA